MSREIALAALIPEETLSRVRRYAKVIRALDMLEDFKRYHPELGLTADYQKESERIERALNLPDGIRITFEDVKCYACQNHVDLVALGERAHPEEDTLIVDTFCPCCGEEV